ncbi:ROK family protein [Kitasatospora sp. NPDC058201]|uniref:ROK family protein n=1 Tax=unclassified Kitasatospora TaxID=2633591 RepID=UPI00364AA731
MKPSVEPADRASIRRSNLGLILHRLADHGGRSRTTLAEELGLPRATISSLTGELVELGLVREGELEHAGAVGRPQRTVELDGTAYCGLGIEIAVDHLYAVALDLRGTVAWTSRLALDARGMPPTATLEVVGRLAAEAIATLGSAGKNVVGITVATPGGYDEAGDRVTIATNLDWRDVPLLGPIASQLGATAPPLHVGNDAKLGAVAEYSAAAARGIRDMVYLSGTVGVGAGIIEDGRLMRTAGEIGHLALGPQAQPCACGRSGCWENMVGLDALLGQAADPSDPVRDPSLDLADRLAELRRRAENGDTRTNDALTRVADALVLGTAVLVDLLGPESVVLGGYFAYFGDIFAPHVQAGIDARRIPSTPRSIITTSTYGLASAARGGARVALEKDLYDDPASIATRLFRA